MEVLPASGRWSPGFRSFRSSPGATRPHSLPARDRLQLEQEADGDNAPLSLYRPGVKGGSSPDASLEPGASTFARLLGCGGRNDTEEGALRTVGRIIPPPCRCHKVSILGTRALASCAPTNHVD